MRIAFCIFLALSSLACTRGGLHDAEHAQASVQQLAMNRAAAADGWVETLQQRRAAGEPLSAALVGELLDAARSRALARAAVAEDGEQRRTAYAAYRDLCAGLLRELTAGPDPAAADLLARVRYAISDAEWRMAGGSP